MVDTDSDAATLGVMLFLIACSSVALDLDVTVADTATTEAVPYPDCYAACERLWTPYEECEQFYIRDGATVTVEECQDECGAALLDLDGNGVAWVYDWPVTLDQDISDYGCDDAAQRMGKTPCDRSDSCIDT